MRLVRGAPGSGKTAFVLREFKEALREGARSGPGSGSRIVVPTATLVRHLRHELARDGVVFSPACVVSLHRFIAECAPGLSLVPPALLPGIVRECLESLRLAEFSELKDTDGLTASVVETISLFENNGCTAEKLAAVRNHDRIGRAFSKLWIAVDRAIAERGFTSRPAFIQAAAAGVPAGFHIWMDGFVNLSPLEEEFTASLAKSCDLALTLTDTPGTETMRRFAMRLGATDQLLQGPTRQPVRSVVEAPTLEREADEIARRVLALDDDGISFRRIGVALRDTSGYLTLLQAAFERFGIPARFYFGSSLSLHPATTFAEGLIAGALQGWEFESALATFRAHPRIGHTADFDRFDFAVREAMPGAGAEQLLELCESEWLRRELGACVRIEAWKATVERPAVWQHRITKLLANQYRPGTLAEAEDPAGIAVERSHVAGLHALSGALETAVRCFADAERLITLEEFWRAAAAVIADTVFQIPDDRVDVVHVMSVYEARQWDVDALLVCGMTDRDFPRRRAQNLFFPDARMEKLPAGVLSRKPSQGEQERDERALFDSLCTRASRQLVFTYPAHDASGKSVLPSRFLGAESGEAEFTTTAVPIRPAIAPPNSRGRGGRISSGDLLAQMAQRHRKASVTSLEELAQCRFKFFASRTLGLEAAPERPGERLQPRVTGSILHSALEEWQKDRTRDFVKIFDEVFAAECQKQKLPPGYRLEVKRLEFREIARQVSATDQWPYDSSEAEIELSIELATGIAVSCRVDRLDVIGSDCVIVDYKSGKTAGVKQKLESESHLQGPFYAMAVRETRGLNPVAVVFWAVRADEQYGWGHIPNATAAVNESLQPMAADWASAARTRVEARLAEFLNGAVTVAPLDQSQCRWCEFAGACRVESAAEEQPLTSIAGLR